MVLCQNVVNGMFLSFDEQYTDPITSVKEVCSRLCVVPQENFFFFFQFVLFSEDPCLNWGVILNFAEFLGVGNQNVLFVCSDLLVRSSSISYVVRSGSLCGFMLRIAVSIGLRNLDCFRVNTRNSVISWFFYPRR